MAWQVKTFLIINNSIINPEGAVPDRNCGTAAAFKKSKSGEKKWLRKIKILFPSAT